MVTKLREPAPPEETSLFRFASEQGGEHLETLEQKVERLVIEQRGGSWFSGKAFNASYVGMDFSWLVRTVTDLFPNSTKYSFFYQSEGLASAFNFVIGIYDVVKSFFRVERAWKIGDHDGAIDAAIDLTRAGIQAGGGAVIIAYRPIAMVAAAQTASVAGLAAPSLIGRISYGLGQLATGIFGIFYMLCGINGARSLFRLVKFYTKYYQCKTPEAKYNFLVQRLNASDQEIKDLKNYKDDEKLEKKYIKEAKTILPLIYPEEKIRNDVLQDDKQLAKIGCLFAQNKLRMKKEAELTRLIGAKAVKDIQSKSVVLPELQRVAIEKIVIASLAVLFGFVGIAAAVAGFIFTGPVGFMLVTLVTIFCVILPMGFVDAYSHYVDLRESGPGKHDKKFLIINSVVALIAMGISIALTSIFSFGILPILLTLLVSGVWLGLNAISYRNILNIERNAKKKEEEERQLIESLTNFTGDDIPLNSLCVSVEE